MSPHPAAKRARAFAVCALVFSLAALVAAIFSALVAIVLAGLAIVSAAAAWMRNDPSVGGGRVLAASSLAIALVAGVLGVANGAIGSSFADRASPLTVVTPVDGSSPSTSEVVVGDAAIEIGAATASTDGSGGVLVPVTVTNVSGAVRSFDVHLVATDSAGNAVATDTVSVSELDAGASSTVPAFAGADASTARRVVAATTTVSGVDER